MRFYIQCKNFRLPDEMRDRIRSRLGFALARFDHRVRDITTSLADVNGPKGGVDKQCRIVVGLRPKGNVMIEQAASDFATAIGRAADRAGHTVGRALKRRRDAKIRRNGLSPRVKGEP